MFSLLIHERDILIFLKTTAVISVIGQVKELDAKVTVIHDHLVNILINVTSLYANILIDESF